MPPDSAFRFAAAVDRRGIDPVDSGFHRTLERIVAGRLVGIDQDAARNAAAESQLGNLQAGPSE